MNMAYHAVTLRKNVVFFSLEMPLSQAARRTITRHSNHPAFKVQGGLDYNSIKHGRLSQDNEKIFYNVIDDFSDASRYGRFHIMQLPHYSTVRFLREQLEQINHSFPVDLAVVDYVQLLRSERARAKRQEEVVEILKDLKQLAIDFDNGRGIPVITPYQITREARKRADKSQEYDLDFLSDTSAAERTAGKSSARIPGRESTDFL